MGPEGPSASLLHVGVCVTSASVRLSLGQHCAASARRGLVEFKCTSADDANSAISADQSRGRAQTRAAHSHWG